MYKEIKQHEVWNLFKISLVPFSAPPKKDDAEQVTTNLVALNNTHLSSHSLEESGSGAWISWILCFRVSQSYNQLSYQDCHLI